ncbi:uncharacterized protein LOC143881172 isoform X2 [Tasmannia lanceolata]|uniref:uncharacterized protein LOC143881172 isoform X2 n=1 Tax=Tasmannia lanceolata TaxID=3420 RepID=UPI0040639521
MNSDMGEWSEVPNELLVMVLDRLPHIIDQIWFGAMCSSWYQVAKENRHWLDFQDKLPLMMLPDKERTQIQLPSLDKFPDNQNSNDPEEPRDYRYMFKTLLSANPISTPNYVVTIVTNLLKLSFYKPGDEINGVLMKMSYITRINSMQSLITVLL